MGYAIIETGGQQFRVEVGRFYDVDRIHADEDSKLTFDKVLFVDNDGDASVGQPFVEGATVEATVMRHLRGRKVIVYKMRPKKKTRKKQGHRQELTRLMIESIMLNGTAIAGSTEVADTAPSTEAEPAATEASEDPADTVAAEA